MYQFFFTSHLIGNVPIFPLSSLIKFHTGYVVELHPSTVHSLQFASNFLQTAVHAYVVTMLKLF